MKPVASALVLAVTLICIAQATCAGQPAPARVAVFDQHGFPSYGSPDILAPQSIATALGRCGVDADLLDASQISDPAKLNATNYVALVLAYGNTYPDEALANIRAFHHAGGSLITCGVPFTHAVARQADGSWKDLGHNSEPALFGGQGVGAGGWFSDTVRTGGRAVNGGIFGLTRAMKDWPGWAQPLDLRSFPAGDKVTPVITTSGKPFVALVEHHGDGFDGAVDAWCNYPHPSDMLRNEYDAEQISERGTIAVLYARGSMTAVQRDSAFALLDTDLPPKVFANVSLPALARPYPTLQPKSPPLNRTLVSCDVRLLPKDQQLLLFSLQGLVNRKQPRLYLISGDQDAFWLSVLLKQNDIDTAESVADPLSLVSKFRDAFRGAVIPDPNIYTSRCIAADFAAAEDLVIATPELAAKMNIPIVEDLRGRFFDDADGMRYVRTRLMSRLNPFVAAEVSPMRIGSQIDDIISARGISFWVCGPMEKDESGVNIMRETEEEEALYAAMPLCAIVRGFPWAGDGFGQGEFAGVSMATRFGKMVTASDTVANLSVFSGVSIDRLTQKVQPPAPKLDPSKVYFAITLSDGDNFDVWRKYMLSLLNDPLRGTFPVAFGMGPTLIDSAGPMAKWVYDTAPSTDEFICDVSGAGYIYPPQWAELIKNRDMAYTQFYTKWTQEYLKRMDMKAVRIMRVDTPDIAQAGKLMPDVRCLVPDYGWVREGDYDKLTYMLPTGQSVFRAATYGPKGDVLASELQQRVGSVRPAFVNAFIWFWGSSLGSLKQMQETLGPNYVAVTPSQLDSLYRQAKAQGLAR